MSRTNKIIACILCFAALFALGSIVPDLSAPPDIMVENADTVIISDVSSGARDDGDDAAAAYADYQFGTDSNNHRLNINRASLSQLSALDGIGDTLAQRIVDYREKNGDFKSTRDILRVKGIGETKYNKFKDYITVGGEQG